MAEKQHSRGWSCFYLAEGGDYISIVPLRKIQHALHLRFGHVSVCMIILQGKFYLKK